MEQVSVGIKPNQNAINKPCTRTISSPGKQNITVLLAASPTTKKCHRLLFSKEIISGTDAFHQRILVFLTVHIQQYKSNEWREITFCRNLFTKKFFAINWYIPTLFTDT